MTVFLDLLISLLPQSISIVQLVSSYLPIVRHKIFVWTVYLHFRFLSARRRIYWFWLFIKIPSVSASLPPWLAWNMPNSIQRAACKKGEPMGKMASDCFYFEAAKGTHMFTFTLQTWYKRVGNIALAQMMIVRTKTAMMNPTKKGCVLACVRGSSC